MSAPKSTVKIKTVGKKGDKGVTLEYTDNCDATLYYMHELCRAALRDVAKYLVKGFRAEYYNHFHKRTGAAGRVTKYKVFSSKTTTDPRVQIGLKTGRTPGFYGYFQEVGTSRTAKLGLLTRFAESHVSEIMQIEGQYLSALNNETPAVDIPESDFEGGGDE